MCSNEGGRNGQRSNEEPGHADPALTRRRRPNTEASDGQKTRHVRPGRWAGDEAAKSRDPIMEFAA
jgi:hypothetical protein